VAVEAALMPQFRVRHCDDAVRILVDATVSARRNLYVPLKRHARRTAVSSAREVICQRDDKEIMMEVRMLRNMCDSWPL
jgi:hypothetical protein